MVGRAGRPQFDTEGVAVIMTSRDSTSRYQRLLAGQVRRVRHVEPEVAASQTMHLSRWPVCIWFGGQRRSDPDPSARHW